MNRARPHILRFFLLACIMCPVLHLSAQKILLATIRDQHSSEPVPFASIQWKISGAGRQADSAGNFSIHVSTEPGDSLIITSVGYQDYIMAADILHAAGDTIKMYIDLVPGKFTAEVVVRKK